MTDHPLVDSNLAPFPVMSLANFYRLLHQRDYFWLTRPFLVFLASRLLLIAAGYFSALVLPPIPVLYLVHAAPGNIFVDMWSRWDSTWYLHIAGHGYFYIPGVQSSIAFFPVYPLAISILLPLFGNGAAAGVLISNVTFFIALIYLYKLAELEFRDDQIAARTLFYIALFPTALFFSAVYTEGLFLLLSVATFYYLRREQWGYAALFGIFCSATRVVGVGITGIAALAWLQAHGWHWQRILKVESWQKLGRAMRTYWLSLLAVCLIPCGMGLFMVYQAVHFGNPFAFLAAQREWGNTPTGPINVILTTIQGELDGRWMWGEPRIIDLAAFFFAFIVSLVVWRRLGYLYGLYSLFCILIPASSTLQSMSRYVVVIFPLFMILAVWGRDRKLHWAIMIASTIFSCIFMATYVTWRFIG